MNISCYTLMIAWLSVTSKSIRIIVSWTDYKCEHAYNRNAGSINRQARERCNGQITNDNGVLGQVRNILTIIRSG